MVRTFIATLILTAALGAQPQRPRITGVAHIALFVHDMEKSRAYYKDFLGFGEPYSLEKSDSAPAVTFIKVNDRQYIELFPEVEAGSDRLNHIAVETDNVDAMRVYLASKGITVPAKPTLGRIKNLSFTVKDPDGHDVEFVQYMPGGWSTREKGKYMPAERVSARMMHVGIIVGDLDRAMKFYRDILGFQEFWRGSRDGKVLDWVNVKAPDGDTYIEFMLYGDLPAPTARGSAHHMCLEVPDINKTKAWLESRPAAKDYTRPLEIRTGINRKHQMNLFDPDGTRSEVMEPVTVDGKPAASATAPPPQPASTKK
jgi:catechol 2,3-dioxygenase-like lactoylglutathione lyase family enzyme